MYVAHLRSVVVDSEIMSDSIGHGIDSCFEQFPHPSHHFPPSIREGKCDVNARRMTWRLPGMT